jgi:hypothetical protein
MSVSYNFDAGEILEDFDRYLKKIESRIQYEEKSKQITTQLESVQHGKIREIMEHYFRFDEKSRLVHDIIRCADSIEARRFVRSICRRAHHRNQTGTIFIGQRTEYTEMPHVHIVHSCAWTGLSCR